MVPQVGQESQNATSRASKSLLVAVEAEGNHQSETNILVEAEANR